MRVDPARVRDARHRRLLTQVELAERAGLTESTLNRIEQGLQQPRISTLRKLAAALDVPAHELLDDPPADLARPPDA